MHAKEGNVSHPLYLLVVRSLGGHDRGLARLCRHVLSAIGHVSAQFEASVQQRHRNALLGDGGVPVGNSVLYRLGPRMPVEEIMPCVYPVLIRSRKIVLATVVRAE